MALTAAIQTIYDGPRRAKIQITGTSDGSGEVTLAPLAVARSLAPMNAATPCKRVKVEYISGNTSYGNIELYWEAEVPLKFAELAGTTIDMDYRNITALTPPPSLISWTGNILYSTTGFAAGSTFMLEVELIKGA